MSYDEADVTCVQETPQAIRVRRDGYSTTLFWVPKSVIDDDSEVYEEGGRGKLVVALWWAENQGWI